MNLDSPQSDRAAGVLVALAAGDALGAGYEFGAPLPDDAPVTMKGGGPFGFAPAEWTDDTSMAVAVAEAMLDAAGDGQDPVGDASLSAMVQRWVEWARTSKDVGAQTGSVLSSVASALSRGSEVSAADAAFAAALELHKRHGRSGGNGSLMRTGPVALCYLDAEPRTLFDAAVNISALTHHDPDGGEACALWSLAIRHAVLTGELDVRVGLDLLPSERAALWLDRIEEAERSLPRDFDKNGWVVQAFQGAWSAIVSTVDFAASPAHLRAALEACVRGGRDTDTVAAIAGGLLGAAYGYSAIPFEWRRRLHGWPGYRAGDLMRIASQLARGRGRTPGAWPDLERFDNSGYIAADRTDVVVHPLDDGVLLGGAPALSRDDYDAVVSLSRVGTVDGARVPAKDRASFWLLDSAGPGANAHVEFVLQDAAEAVRRFRSEGKRVLLHCVRMESRTPTVAALYGSLVSGLTPLEALDRVREVLPNARPNDAFMEMLRAASLEQRRPCPHCGEPRPDHLIPRNYLCLDCLERATDSDGRRVALFNGFEEQGDTLVASGLDARYEDGSLCSEVASTQLAFVDGQAYRAGEGRFGGVCMWPLSAPEAEAAATSKFAALRSASPVPVEENVISTDAESINSDRDANMLARYIDGETLAAIGADYGVSRERVRQIVTKLDGSQAEASRKRRAEQRFQDAARASESFLRQHGDTIALLAGTGSTRDDARERICALFPSIDIQLLETVLALPQFVWGRERSEYFSDDVIAAAVWYLLGADLGLAPDYSYAAVNLRLEMVRELKEKIQDSEVTDSDMATILGVIGATMKHAAESPESTINGQRYEALRTELVGALGAVSRRGSNPWPPTRQTVMRRLGGGLWSPALAKLGIGTTLRGRRPGLLKFTENDYAQAVQRFVSEMRQHQMKPSVDRYAAWVIAEQRAGRGWPSAPSIRNYYNGWSEAVRQADERSAAQGNPRAGSQVPATRVLENPGETDWPTLVRTIQSALSETTSSEFLVVEYGDGRDGQAAPYAQASPHPRGAHCEIVSERFLSAEECAIDRNWLLSDGWSEPTEEHPNWTKHDVPLVHVAETAVRGLRHGRGATDPSLFRWHIGTFPPAQVAEE